MREAVQEIEAATSTIIEPRKVADAGLWETDLETMETVMDPSLERMYGHEPGEFGETYEDWVEHVHPEDRPKVEDAWERAVEGGDPYHIVYRIIRDDGAVRWIDSRARIITDEAGEPVQMWGLNTDITESQERVQQLQVLDRVLRHNLRNDMAVILGHVETIAEDAESPVADHAEAALAVAEELLDTARKQQTISRLISTDPQPRRVDLVPRVEGVIAKTREAYPEATIEDDLPPTLGVGVIDSFDEALAEVVRNAVVHNDLDAPTVVVALEPGDDAVRVRIADDGPGIPETERKVVTGETAISPLEHASGLGLWLVSWVVRRSGGTIRFEDREPRGTVFVIELPRWG